MKGDVSFSEYSYLGSDGFNGSLEKPKKQKRKESGFSDIGANYKIKLPDVNKFKDDLKKLKQNLLDEHLSETESVKRKRTISASKNDKIESTESLVFDDKHVGKVKKNKHKRFNDDNNDLFNGKEALFNSKSDQEDNFENAPKKFKRERSVSTNGSWENELLSGDDQNTKKHKKKKKKKKLEAIEEAFENIPVKKKKKKQHQEFFFVDVSKIEKSSSTENLAKLNNGDVVVKKKKKKKHLQEDFLENINEIEKTTFMENLENNNFEDIFVKKKKKKHHQEDLLEDVIKIERTSSMENLEGLEEIKVKKKKKKTHKDFFGNVSKLEKGSSTENLEQIDSKEVKVKKKKKKKHCLEDFFGNVTKIEKASSTENLENIDTEEIYIKKKKRKHREDVGDVSKTEKNSSNEKTEKFEEKINNISLNGHQWEISSPKIEKNGLKIKKEKNKIKKESSAESKHSNFSEQTVKLSKNNQLLEENEENHKIKRKKKNRDILMEDLNSSKENSNPEIVENESIIKSEKNSSSSNENNVKTNKERTSFSGDEKELTKKHKKRKNDSPNHKNISSKAPPKFLLERDNKMYMFNINQEKDQYNVQDVLNDYELPEKEMDYYTDMVERSFCQKEIEIETYLNLLRNFKVSLPFSVPDTHKIETRITGSCTKEQNYKFKELGVEMKTNKYSKDEDNIILKNWKLFCKEHDWKDDMPEPFLKLMISCKKFLLPQNERLNFVRYLAHDLPHRKLASVYIRFQRLFKDTKVMGKFTPDEDKVILNYMQQNSKHVFTDLEVLLKRPKNCIQRRYAKLMEHKKFPVDANRKDLINNPEYLMEFLDSLLSVANLQNVADLEYFILTKEHYKKLAEKIQEPVSMVEYFWNHSLYPRLFVPVDVTLDDIRRKLIRRLKKNNYADWKKVDWTAISISIKGTTHLFIYKLFYHIVKKLVPEKMRKNLQHCLEYLDGLEFEDTRVFTKITYKDNRMKIMDREPQKKIVFINK